MTLLKALIMAVACSAAVSLLTMHGADPRDEAAARQERLGAFVLTFVGCTLSALATAAVVACS